MHWFGKARGLATVVTGVALLAVVPRLEAKRCKGLEFLQSCSPKALRVLEGIEGRERLEKCSDFLAGHGLDACAVDEVDKARLNMLRARVHVAFARKSVVDLANKSELERTLPQFGELSARIRTRIHEAKAAVGAIEGRAALDGAEEAVKGMARSPDLKHTKLELAETHMHFCSALHNPKGVIGLMAQVRKCSGGVYTLTLTAPRKTELLAALNGLPTQAEILEMIAVYEQLNLKPEQVDQFNKALKHATSRSQRLNSSFGGAARNDQNLVESVRSQVQVALSKHVSDSDRLQLLTTAKQIFNENRSLFARPEFAEATKDIMAALVGRLAPVTLVMTPPLTIGACVESLDGYPLGRVPANARQHDVEMLQGKRLKFRVRAPGHRPYVKDVDADPSQLSSRAPRRQLEIDLVEDSNYRPVKPVVPGRTVTALDCYQDFVGHGACDARFFKANRGQHVYVYSAYGSQPGSELAGGRNVVDMHCTGVVDGRRETHPLRIVDNSEGGYWIPFSGSRHTFVRFSRTHFDKDAGSTVHHDVEAVIVPGTGELLRMETSDGVGPIFRVPANVDRLEVLARMDSEDASSSVHSITFGEPLTAWRLHDHEIAVKKATRLPLGHVRASGGVEPRRTTVVDSVTGRPDLDGKTYSFDSWSMLSAIELEVDLTGLPVAVAPPRITGTLGLSVAARFSRLADFDALQHVDLRSLVTGSIRGPLGDTLGWRFGVGFGGHWQRWWQSTSDGGLPASNDPAFMWRVDGELFSRRWGLKLRIEHLPTFSAAFEAVCPSDGTCDVEKGKEGTADQSLLEITGNLWVLLWPNPGAFVPSGLFVDLIAEYQTGPQDRTDGDPVFSAVHAAVVLRYDYVFRNGFQVGLSTGISLVPLADRLLLDLWDLPRAVRNHEDLEFGPAWSGATLYVGGHF